MKFCPKCDNILLVKKITTKKKGKEKQEKYLYCSSCGYSEAFDKDKDSESYTIKEKIERSGKDKTVILLTSVDNGKITEDEREALEDFFKPDLN
ncbi:MAG: hypothetical protein ACTSVI_04000 [Promethearchaeota archaeon]